MHATASVINSLMLLHEGLGEKAQAFSLPAFVHSPLYAPAYADLVWQAPAHASLPMLRATLPANMTELPGPLYVGGVCASTLDVAHDLAARGDLPVWGSLVALQQQAGRGQLGRAWYSVPGNVFATVRLPMRAPFDGLAAAPAMGALLAAALTHMGHAVWLKWPNDLVSVEPANNEQPETACKVCGILLEERAGCLLAGIGINLLTAPPATALREGHALPGGCLPNFPGPKGIPSPLYLWQRLVSRVKFCYEQTVPGHAACTPTTSWRHQAEKRLLYKGQQVVIVDGGRDAVTVQGILSGLDDGGGLRICADGAMHTVHSGSLLSATRLPLKGTHGF